MQKLAGSLTSPSMLRAAAVGLLWVAVACGDPKDPPYLRDARVAPGGEGFSLALEQAVSHGMKSGHRVALIDNGEVFPAIEGAIRGAKSSVHLLLYIWKPGVPSDGVLRALAERSRGVECRVVVDSLGSEAFPKEVRPALERMGCEVRMFETRGGDRDLESRNHRKLVIVDGQRGITGGFGIDKVWLGEGLTRDEWRDQHVLVEGPAVREMQLAFAENWLECGGGLLPDAAFPALEEGRSSVRATFTASSPEGGVSYGERMTQVLFSAARRRIWVTNAYFVPPPGVVEKLIAKRREGVDVRVLVPGPIHDQPLVRIAQRGTYQQLLEAGVRVFEYQPSMIHSKTVVLDDRLAVVGSNNLEPYSMEKLEEGSLLVEDPAMNRALAERFEQDLRVSKEMHPDSPELRFLGVKRVARRAMWLIGRR